MLVKDADSSVQFFSNRYLAAYLHPKFEKTIHSLLDRYMGSLINEYAELYAKTKELKHDKGHYYLFRVNDTTLFIDLTPYRVNKKLSITIAPEYEKQGEYVVSKIKKVQEDAKFLSMWLSLVFPSDTPKNTLKYCPTSFRPYLSSDFVYYLNEDYERPLGREDDWKKAEKLISFYLGMNLLL